MDIQGSPPVSDPTAGDLNCPPAAFSIESKRGLLRNLGSVPVSYGSYAVGLIVPIFLQLHGDSPRTQCHEAAGKTRALHHDQMDQGLVVMNRRQGPVFHVVTCLM